MKLTVKVKTNAKKNQVTRNSDVDFLVETTAPPLQGKANQAVIKLLADYFHVAKSQVDIIHGHKSSNKFIEIT